MRKRYFVKKEFENEHLGRIRVGQEVCEKDLKYLTCCELKLLKVMDFSKVTTAFNYGAIFHSKEYPFPEIPPEETRDDMIEYLKREAKNDRCNCEE